MLLVLGRRMEVKDGRTEAAAEASGRFRMDRFNVVTEHRYVVTVFVAVRAERYPGVAGSIAPTLGLVRPLLSLSLRSCPDLFRIFGSLNRIRRS